MAHNTFNTLDSLALKGSYGHVGGSLYLMRLRVQSLPDFELTAKVGLLQLVCRMDALDCGDFLLLVGEKLPVVPSITVRELFSCT